jgi:hypothetical protein
MGAHIVNIFKPYASLVSVFVFLSLFCTRAAKELNLEAEDGIGRPVTISRTNASNGLAVRVDSGRDFQTGFCLKQRTIVQVGAVYLFKLAIQTV